MFVTSEIEDIIAYCPLLLKHLLVIYIRRVKESSPGILDSFYNILQNKRKLQFSRTRNNGKVSKMFFPVV